jgi:hypothetical protein
MSTLTQKAALGLFYGFHAVEVAAVGAGVVGLLALLLVF